MKTTTWQCSGCKQENQPEEKFCGGCGQSQEVKSLNEIDNKKVINKKNGSSGKKIGVLLAVLFLAGAAAAGFFLYQANKQKDIAKNYLLSAQENFSQSVAVINDLTTEKTISSADFETYSLYMEKMRKEKSDAEKALKETKEGKESNNQAKKNDLISGTDALVASYYEEAEKLLDEYDKFIGYDLILSEKFQDFEDEEKKLAGAFRSIRSAKDAEKIFEDSHKNLTKLVEEFDKLEIPPGMEECHKKRRDTFADYAGKIEAIIKASKEKDTKGFLSAESEFRNFMAYDFPKREQEAHELYNNRQEDLHKRFVALREKADLVKSEFIKQAGKFDVTVNIAMIEGW